MDNETVRHATEAFVAFVVPAMCGGVITGGGMFLKFRRAADDKEQKRLKNADSVPALAVSVDGLEKQVTVTRSEQSEGFQALKESNDRLASEIKFGFVRVESGMNALGLEQRSQGDRINAIDKRLERVEGTQVLHNNQTTATMLKIQMDHSDLVNKVVTLDGEHRILKRTVAKETG